MRGAIPRLVLSVAFSAVLPAVCSRLPHINDTTAALLLVLCILGISARWGWPEALTAAIVGGISYDYYFLGPPGFSITAPEFGVALVALVITAIVTGRLTAQLVRRRIEAVERQNEIEKLHRLAKAMTGSGSLERLPDQSSGNLRSRWCRPLRQTERSHYSFWSRLRRHFRSEAS